MAMKTVRNDKIKRTGRCLSLLAVLMIAFICVSCAAAFAEDSSNSFLFDLLANNANEISVEPGDTITVMLRLKRTDSDEPYEMYAMQDEIYYDETCFRLVENGSITADNIQTADLRRQNNERAYYMNFVSVIGGERWESDTMLGMFQLEVIGNSTRTEIENRNFFVSTKDGVGSYPSNANNLSVIIKGDVTVRFATDGGTTINDVIVDFGDLIQRPADPEKKGYTFSGWYKDAECTEPWNFETDKVEADTTIYAKWTKRQISPVVWIIPAGVVIAVVLLLVSRRKR